MRKGIAGWRAVVLSAALFSLSVVSDAAAQAALPGTTRDQIQLRDPTASRRLPPLGVDDKAAEQDPTATKREPTLDFPLEDIVVVDGLTGEQNKLVYDKGELLDIYGSSLGTNVTLGDLREIADRIENHYREDGYIAARAIIPAQSVDDGIVTIKIFEGRIIGYELRGDVGPVGEQGGQIRKLLDNLITNEPARWSEVERYLLLVRDLPGISLTGTLQTAGDQ